VSDPLDALRREIVVARGLGPDAARFLTGGTLRELEASADKLAALLGADTDRGQESSSPFVAMATAKQRSREALTRLFTGPTPPPQLRDERGRFSSKPATLDGGARPGLQRPTQTHEQWLIDTLRSRAADRGVGF
jgi:hypothetical protein